MAFQLDDVYSKQKNLSDYLKSDVDFIQKQRAGQQGIEQNQFKMDEAKVDGALQLLSGVTDENTWQQAKQQAQQRYGFDTSNVPANYDPNWVKSTTNQLLTAKERVGFDVKRQEVDKSNQPPADPSAVREYNYFKGLQPEEQKQYLNVKRNTLGVGVGFDANGQASPLPGYIPSTQQITQAKTASKTAAETGGKRLDKMQEITLKTPVLMATLDDLDKKIKSTNFALLGPATSKMTQWTSPKVQDLMSTARQAALQLKEIYNLGSGQGFTDADRDYLDSIVGGARVHPEAALKILKGMGEKVQLMNNVYKQAADFYTSKNSLTGFVPSNQGGIDKNDQKVQKALQSGYSEQEIMQYLGKR